MDGGDGLGAGFGAGGTVVVAGEGAADVVGSGGAVVGGEDPLPYWEGAPASQRIPRTAAASSSTTTTIVMMTILTAPRTPTC